MALFESFFSSVNCALIKYSLATNKVITLPLPPPKPPKCPLLSQIRRNLKAARTMSNPNPNTIKSLCKESKKLSSRHVKSLLNKTNLTFNSIISKDPTKAFKAIRKSKNSKTKNINSLTVGKITYEGNCIKDGFYDSLSALKCPPTSLSHGNYDLDYKIILWLSANDPIPPISIQNTEKNPPLPQKTRAQH